MSADACWCRYVVLQLLGSKTQTDVEESIEFFTTAAQFSVEAANSGIRKMLLLVWSKEQGTRDAYVLNFVLTLLVYPCCMHYQRANLDLCYILAQRHRSLLEAVYRRNGIAEGARQIERGRCGGRQAD